MAAKRKKIYVKGKASGAHRKLKLPTPVRKNYDVGDELPLGYVVDEVIAKGGSGIVLKVHKPSIRPPIYKAIKVINPESVDERGNKEDVQDEFYGEAKVSFEIGSDPYAVGVEDILEMPDGTRALVFPFIDGRTLATLNYTHVCKGLLLPFELSAFLFHRILSVLVHAKERGIAHRDLCLNNIIVQRTGVPMLLDWGAGTDVNNPMLVGKPGYIAPEAVKQPDGMTKESVFKGDIFSLGAVLRELLIGYNVLEPDPELAASDPYEALAMRETINTDDLTSVAEVCADVPQVLSDIVTACMSENPWDRPDAEQLYDYMGASYLYTPQVGYGITAEVLEHYLRFVHGSWNPLAPLPDDKLGRSLAKIVRSRVRRIAEQPDYANLMLKAVIQQCGVEYIFGNVVRSFADAHGEVRLTACRRQALIDALEDEYSELSMGPGSLLKQEYDDKRAAIDAANDEKLEQVLMANLSGSDPKTALNIRLFETLSAEGF